MKYLLLLLLIKNFLFSCTGDCLTCHPKLIPTIHTDKRHSPMLTCIKCHSADPKSMSECGDDCFACHSMKKINSVGVKEHNVIQKCRDCHVTDIEKILDSTQTLEQSQTNSLKDFLVK